MQFDIFQFSETASSVLFFFGHVVSWQIFLLYFFHWHLETLSSLRDIPPFLQDRYLKTPSLFVNIEQALSRKKSIQK